MKDFKGSNLLLGTLFNAMICIPITLALFLTASFVFRFFSGRHARIPGFSPHEWEGLLAQPIYWACWGGLFALFMFAEDPVRQTIVRAIRRCFGRKKEAN